MYLHSFYFPEAYVTQSEAGNDAGEPGQENEDLKIDGGSTPVHKNFIGLPKE